MLRKKLILAAIGLTILFLVNNYNSSVQAFERSTLRDLSGNLVDASNPATPIQHIIIIMNENHAFDNFFGT